MKRLISLSILILGLVLSSSTISRTPAPETLKRVESLPSFQSPSFRELPQDVQAMILEVEANRFEAEIGSITADMLRKLPGVTPGITTEELKWTVAIQNLLKSAIGNYQGARIGLLMYGQAKKQGLAHEIQVALLLKAVEESAEAMRIHEDAERQISTLEQALQSRRSKIEASPRKQANAGTGWIVSDGLVATNHHLIDGTSKITVIFRGGNRIAARLERADRINDLAILTLATRAEPNAGDSAAGAPPSLPGSLPVVKSWEEGAPGKGRPLTKGTVPPRPAPSTPGFSVLDALVPKAIPLAVSPAKIGGKVFTIGYPHPDTMGTNSKLTDGVISAISGLRDDPRFYQVTVPLQAGNSGGPLLNVNGEVIGVITSKLNAAKMLQQTGDLPQNVNYAVKVAYLKILMDSLPERIPATSVLPRNAGTLENLAARVQGSIVMIIAE